MIITVNDSNKKQQVGRKNFSRFKAIGVAQLYKRNTLSSRGTTTDNLSPIPDHMWNLRMAQYAITYCIESNLPHHQVVVE